MKEVGPVRFRYVGDIPSCMQYHNEGRKVLGKLKGRMKLGGIGGGWYREEVDDYTLIKAESLMGQDIVTIERYAAEEGGEEREYHPYLWVGVRGVSYDKTDPAESPYAHLCVWEPPPEPDSSDPNVFPRFVSPRYYFLSFFAGMNFDVSPSGDHRTDPPALNFIPFTTDGYNNYPEAGSFPPGDWGVNYTDNNLYLLGSTFAWDPELDPQNPDPDKMWEQVAVLDPADRVKTFDGIGLPFRWSGGQSEAFTFDGNPGPLKLTGNVLPGLYAIKVCSQNYNECITTAATFELELRLGKPPGDTFRKRFTFNIPRASNWSREILPYGYYGHTRQAGEPPDFNGIGPNPHGDNWWQATIMVNVQEGYYFVVGDESDSDETNYLYLTDGRYRMPHHDDAPFAPDSPEPEPGSCGCVQGALVDPLKLTFRPWAINDDGILYAVAPTYLGFMTAYVTAIHATEDEATQNICQVQIKNDCLSLGAEYHPLGQGQVWKASGVSSVGKTQWNLGDKVFVKDVGEGIILHVMDFDDPEADNELFNQANLTCPGTTGHRKAIEDLELLGWVFGIVGGYELPVIDPDGKPKDYS